MRQTYFGSTMVKSVAEIDSVVTQPIYLAGWATAPQHFC